MSACNITREIGVTYKTAWRMLQQIRAAMENITKERLFSNVVEIDETYIGGKPRYRNPYTKRGRGTNKTPVAGIIERQSKQVSVKVMPPNRAGQALTGKQLFDFIQPKITRETTIMTDTFRGYSMLDNTYTHKTVNHSIGQYSAGNGIHTNTIENFWSIGKRSIIGVYHSVSRKYLADSVNTGNKVAYSTDGINFQLGTIPSLTWRDITYGNGRFVAIGDFGSMYFLDGINFTKTFILNKYMLSIAYNNSV